MLHLNLKFILYFAYYYGIRVIKRGPSYLIASLTTPLTLLFVVYVLTKGALVDFAIVGGMVSLIASLGLQSAGDATFMRLQLRFQEMYVASQVGPIDYMLGLTLSFLAFAIPGIILYAILGAVSGLYNIETSLFMAFIIIMLILSTSAISFIIAGLIKHVRNIWGITSILSIIMTVIPPTFYPYQYLTERAYGNLIMYLLSISPATPAAISTQIFFHLSEGSTFTLYTMLGILIGETVIFFTVARYLTRWRED